MMLLSVLTFFCLVSNSFERSTPLDDHYVAAVVEYQVSRNIEENTANYVKHIKEAADQQADIIVFPELTLTNRSYTFEVPIYGALKEHPVPALYPSEYDEVIVAISAAARANGIYVVINARELMDCTNSTKVTGEYCPEQKEYVFNTNVVFDRTGAVIDRYRKINLFGEAGHTPALRPDLGVFETDFGVKFGHFICFDLMFQVPSVQVVQKENIKNVIFPTMWFSELPYLTAVQIQEAYAYSLDVNFLGAGANQVRVGSAGSGIYSGKAGALVSIMPGVQTTRVLVSRVPKVPGQVSGTYPGPIYDKPSDHDNLRLITDPSLAAHVSRLLVPGFQEFSLTDGDVSCSFRVRLSQRDNTRYSYRAGAFSGVRSFSGVATGGMRACSVYACAGENRSTCGTRFPTYEANTTAIFEELSIVAILPTPVRNLELKTDNSVVYPVSLSVSILPLESSEYSYSSNTNGNNVTHTLTLVNNAAEIYTLAVWGRQFTTDGLDADPPLENDVTPADPAPGAASIHILSNVLIALAALLYIQL